MGFVTASLGIIISTQSRLWRLRMNGLIVGTETNLFGWCPVIIRPELEVPTRIYRAVESRRSSQHRARRLLGRYGLDRASDRDRNVVRGLIRNGLSDIRCVGR